VQQKLAEDSPALTFTEALALYSHDPNLHKAILFSHSELASSARSLNSAIPPQPTLKSVLEDQYKNLKELHNSILDSCSFLECIQSLINNKTPGPEGIANELLKYLPHKYKESIHKLFVIMCATGITPKAWKKSDAILIFKDKGPETDITSYRPIGLANTLYKL